MSYFCFKLCFLTLQYLYFLSTVNQSIFSNLVDKVEFNERIDRPPEDLAKPRKAKEKSTKVCLYIQYDKYVKD